MAAGPGVVGTDAGTKKTVDFFSGLRASDRFVRSQTIFIRAEKQQKPLLFCFKGFSGSEGFYVFFEGNNKKIKREPFSSHHRSVIQSKIKSMGNMERG